MAFFSQYPDLSGLNQAQQVEELYNKFIALSREVEFAVNHIDSTNFTTAYSKSLTLSIENKAEKRAAYYEFGDEALTVYSAGIKIRKGTPVSPGETVFYADGNGNLTLKDITVNTATMENITIRNGSLAVLDGGGDKAFSVGGDGECIMGSIEFTDKDIICGHLISYANEATGLNAPSLILSPGVYGFSFSGSSPAYEDYGITIHSSYKRSIAASSGIPTDSEKRYHSGLTLDGDVVISNFGDSYYRYPVVGDGNYKIRMHVSGGTLKVVLYNAKTNGLVSTYTFNPDSVA